MMKSFLAVLLGAVSMTPLAATAQDDGGREHRAERADRQQRSDGGWQRQTPPHQESQRQTPAGGWGRADQRGAPNGGWGRPDQRGTPSGGWNTNRPPQSQQQPQSGGWQDRRNGSRQDRPNNRDNLDAQRQRDRAAWQANQVERGDFRQDRRPIFQNGDARDRAGYADNQRGQWSGGGWNGDRGYWRGGRQGLNDRRDFWRDRSGYEDRRAWNRDWRRDSRYDWSRYRYANRGLYRLPRYYAPYGWNYGYRRFSIGVRLSSLLYAQDYWIDDPWSYRLPEAYGEYRWVRFYNDALLVDIYSGEVVDVINDIFW